jgi:AraC family transcriptional regulator, ethanolamine operon transcriptional activator
MGGASIGYPQTVKTRQGNVELTQSHVTVVEIWDPITAEEDTEVVNQSLVQLRSEPLRARRVVVRLETSVLIYHSTNLAVRVRTKLENGLLGFLVFGPQAAGTVNGLQVRPDLMLMAAPATEGRFTVDAGYESLAIGISPADIEAHLKARGQWNPSHSQHPLNPVVCDPAKARTLFTFGKRMALTAAQQPDLFNGNKEVRAASEVELVEALLDTIDSSEDYTVTRSDKTHQTYSDVVRLVEEYVLTHVDTQIFVTDLCKAAAVSQRTLEYAFKEILGLSPIAYLQRLRLHRVRQALRVGTRATTTVSTEALKWGFWHFGDFSKAYKNCFGESPSETLRREASESKSI